MAQQFDLAIIGTGTAATVAALRACDAGWRVAVIDMRRFGGTCALRGCDPKKVLVDAAAAVDHARRLQGKGISGATRIDWQELMAFKREFTEPVPERREKLYADKGIAAFHGLARFTGKNTLEVDGASLEARYILIAAGVEAAPLGIPGEEYLVTNELFLTMDVLPRHIVIVGGGYIAAEFSHIVARAGARVTILERGPSMLPLFAREMVALLMASFRAVGVDVYTNTKVEAVEKCGAGYRVRASNENSPLAFDGDLVVHAAGRAPNFASLQVEAAGIELEKGKLQLNEYLQSVSNPAVYAAGDTAGKGPPLTPVASYDAKVAVANILEGNHQKVDYRVVPSVAFTIPPIASVGLDEAKATKENISFRVNCQNASDWYTARRTAQPVYGFKVLVEEGSDRLLGAHLVGPNADELINVFALAIRMNLTASDLKAALFAYPTSGSDIAAMLS
jgi:glutathione reductase (NADPH)